MSADPHGGLHGVYQRKYQPVERTMTTHSIIERLFPPKPAAPSDPCAGCRHAERCAQGLACRALELFVNVGRVSEFAPRQPSRDLYLRLYPEAAAGPA